MNKFRKEVDLNFHLLKSATESFALRYNNDYINLHNYYLQKELSTFRPKNWRQF